MDMKLLLLLAFYSLCWSAKFNGENKEVALEVKNARHDNGELHTEKVKSPRNVHNHVHNPRASFSKRRRNSIHNIFGFGNIKILGTIQGNIVSIGDQINIGDGSGIRHDHNNHKRDRDSMEEEFKVLNKITSEEFTKNDVCAGKPCGATPCRTVNGRNGICDGNGMCTDPVINQCVGQDCAGKVCGDSCSMGAVIGWCDVQGECKSATTDCDMFPQQGKLEPGKALVAPNGLQELLIQPDGNLGISSEDGRIKWSSDSFFPGSFFAFQGLDLQPIPRGDIPVFNYRSDSRLDFQFWRIDGQLFVDKNEGFKLEIRGEKNGSTVIMRDKLDLTEKSPGNFSSLGYPDNYPPNIESTWTITAKENEIVKFELDRDDLQLPDGALLLIWNSLNISGNPDVVINDPRSAWRGLIHFSTGQELSAFFAPGGISDRGFQATVSSIPSFKNRTFELEYDDTITITSPHYTGHNIKTYEMKEGEEADWTFSVKEGQLIRFEITEWDFASDHDHGQDYDWSLGLYLYNGGPPTENELISGITKLPLKLPHVVQSSSNRMLAVFRMHQGFTKGFKAKVSVTCVDKKISLAEGEEVVISSVDDGSGFSEVETKINIMAIGELEEIMQAIENDLENMKNGRLRRDINNLSADERKLSEIITQVAKYLEDCINGTCDTENIEALLETLKSIFDRLKNTQSVSSDFQQSFSEIKKTFDVIVENAKLSKINGKYVGGLISAWTISVPDGFTVQMQIDLLDVRPTLDFVKIFDGPNDQSNLIEQIGCGLCESLKDLPKLTPTCLCPNPMHITFGASGQTAGYFKTGPAKTDWTYKIIEITGKGFSATCKPVKCA